MAWTSYHYVKGCSPVTMAMRAGDITAANQRYVMGGAGSACSPCVLGPREAGGAVLSRLWETGNTDPGVAEP